MILEDVKIQARLGGDLLRLVSGETLVWPFTYGGYYVYANMDNAFLSRPGHLRLCYVSGDDGTRRGERRELYPDLRLGMGVWRHNAMDEWDYLDCIDGVWHWMRSAYRCPVDERIEAGFRVPEKMKLEHFVGIDFRDKASEWLAARTSYSRELGVNAIRHGVSTGDWEELYRWAACNNLAARLLAMYPDRWQEPMYDLADVTLTSDRHLASYNCLPEVSVKPRVLLRNVDLMKDTQEIAWPRDIAERPSIEALRMRARCSFKPYGDYLVGPYGWPSRAMQATVLCEIKARVPRLATRSAGGAA